MLGADPRPEERLLSRSRESFMLAVNRDIGILDLGLDIADYVNSKVFGLPENVKVH